MSAEQKAEDAIIMEIEIEAPPETIFRALTDARELTRWWVEGGTSNWRIDPRVGGKWFAEGKDTKCGDWTIQGEILRYEPPHVFEYSWIENLETVPDPSHSIVRFDLSAIGAGTRLKLTHYGFTGDLAARDRYRGGWPGVFDLLKEYYAKHTAAD